MKADIEALNLSSRKEFYKNIASQYPRNVCSYSLNCNIGNPLSTLASIPDFAHKNNIRLYLHIPPVHAWFTEAIHAQGIGDFYNLWIGELVKINEAVAARNKREPFPLWDFGGYNALTMEKLPIPGSKEKMQNYYEGSHCLPTAGNAVMNRMFDHGEQSPAFGRLLTSGTLARHFEEQKLQRDFFLSRPGLAVGKQDFLHSIDGLVIKRRHKCSASDKEGS